MPTLHIVIPVYNERGTLGEIVARVLTTPLPDRWSRIITLVDDCSADTHFPAVRVLVDRLHAAGKPLRFLRHEVNQGKGAALQTGFDAILSSDALDDDLVIIRGDRNADYRDVYNVLQACKQQGFRKWQVRAITKAG